MTNAVTLGKIGATGLIAFNNPSVDAACLALPKAFKGWLEQAATDLEIDVLALNGKDRSFVADADIRDFGLPPPVAPKNTQRLVGVFAAFEMITTESPVPWPKALKLGLLNRLIDGGPRDVAPATANEVRAGTPPLRTVGQIAMQVDLQQIVDAKKSCRGTSAALVFTP